MKGEIENIVWDEESPGCWFGYIKGHLLFKIYKWPDKDIWLLSDNLYYTKNKVLQDTPCFSTDEAKREAQSRVDYLYLLLKKEKNTGDYVLTLSCIQSPDSFDFRKIKAGVKMGISGTIKRWHQDESGPRVIDDFQISGVSFSSDQE